MDFPVYNATMMYNSDGIYVVSIVDQPAVESNFLYFKKQERQLFSIDDEDKHIITGCVVRANYPIYRWDEERGDWYINFSAEVIKEMTMKMMKDGTFANISLQHNGKLIEGVEIIEAFIKDTGRGIAPEGFDDIADGSLFMTYKVTDENLWKDIKAGKYGGFSIETICTPVLDTKQHKNNNFSNMKTKKIKKSLFSVLKFGSVETDKGVVYWVGDGDLQIGDELFTENTDGDREKIEDDVLTLPNGTKITVEGGLVTYIEEPIIEEYRKVTKLEAETTDEIPVEDVVEEVIDAVEEEIEDVVEETVEEVVERDFGVEIDALKQEIDDLKQTIADMLQTPAAEPAVDEYKKATKSNGIPAFGSKHRLVY